MRDARPTTVRHLAAALAGLLLGACSGTLFDAAGVPPIAPGAACNLPRHVCSSACVDQTIDACGATCAICTATDANATPSCQPGAGGAYACGQVCAAGWFACSTGCCRATAVAAGDDHACALTSDGGLLCWGKNDAGQLGPAAAGLARSTRPVAVFASGVTAVAGGGRHTCAVQGGTVQCWGANDLGQLGDGSVAVQAGLVSTGLPGATALALGANHSCAITGSGAAAAVQCWGANNVGQLGTGDFSLHLSPFPSFITAGAMALSAGGDTTCAITGGAAKCWGLDLDGQTGSGDTATPRPAKPTPVTVPLTSVIGVVVGRTHACANVNVTLPQPGTPLYCWGAGNEGEMGNGTSALSPVLAPVQASRVDNGKAASVFVAGEAFTCSSKALEAGMKCSGRNDQAQGGLAPSPTVDGNDVAFGGSVVAAAAGRAFTCALVDLGGASVVKCWGTNTDGQLGRDTAPPASSSPTPDLVRN